MSGMEGTNSGDPIWHNPDVRRQALDDIIQAWQRSDQAALHEALHRVDKAVAAGLQSLGLPRGPVSHLDFGSRGYTWIGQKQPQCTLCLNADVFVMAIGRMSLHDDAFRTWVHESIHARQPFTQQQQQVEHEWPGYEEGLAEGLARWATSHMAIRPVSFNYYIMQYETLATSLNLPIHDLWRELWQYGPGQVRLNYPGVVDRIVRRSAKGLLDPARLRLVSDPAFSRKHLHNQVTMNDHTARSSMLSRWSQLLPWVGTA